MKFSKLIQSLSPFLIMSVPWLYLALVWNDMPVMIATHFGPSGMPDKFGPKNELFFSLGIISGTGILMYYILKNIYKIDPKKKYAATNSGLLLKIALVVLILLCAVSLFIIYWSLNGKVAGITFLICGISLFMAYLGNLFHSIKPNYFAGFRLPWTLESEDNWRKTHQLASKIWFIGGIALAIVSLLLSIKACLIVFFCGMMIMVIIPIFYSYNLYRKSLSGK